MIDGLYENSDGVACKHLRLVDSNGSDFVYDNCALMESDMFIVVAVRGKGGAHFFTKDNIKRIYVELAEDHSIRLSREVEEYFGGTW